MTNQKEISDVIDNNTRTIRTYNDSAAALSEYFRGIGPRVEDIERGLNLANTDNDAHVVEIGCGDGRDAEEIIPKVRSYKGFDPSQGLLDIAREKLPEASFVEATATSFDYPANVDVIYAFASLLHVNKDDLKIVFEKVTDSLRTGGIIYISLKEKDEYTKEIKRDEFGERTFYFYNVDTISGVAGNRFETAYEDHQRKGKTNWFTVALRKK
jgi:trans-aconitate methyltransferase